MKTATLRGVGALLLAAALCAALTVASGCRGQRELNGGAEHPDASAGTAAAVTPSPFGGGALVAESVGIDGGDAGVGPNCTGAGDPMVNTADGGTSCTGALAQALFTYGLCSCTTIAASGTLTTDSFDSRKGGPDGGAGGSIGANSGLSWSNTTSIGGNLWTPGGVSASGKGLVRGDLHLGGTLSASTPITVNGNALVVKTLPSNATVLGTVTKVSSVPAPCDCTNIVPIGSITAAHRAPNNDDATIGLSPTAANGSNPVRIDLPCGNYYLSQITMSQALTIAVHGHTALYVDGSVNASGALAFQVDPSATLDLFVAGSFNASGALTLGAQSGPEHCRVFIAGPALSLSASANIGCNIYAPNAQINLSGIATTYGAIFGKGIAESGNATVHYDTSILNAASECCTAALCDDINPCTVDSCNTNGTCSHTPAVNGTVCPGANKCNQTYTCQNAVCTASNPVVCTASDGCHVAGTCNPSTGTCSNPVATDGTTCTGTNKCNQKFACAAGVCTGSNPVACTASDQCHVAGTCDPTTGACSNPPVTDGTVCAGTDKCNQKYACVAGACTGSNPVMCTASDQCHVAGTCNSTTGICSNQPATDGTTCTGTDKCNQKYACMGGACTGSNRVACMAADECHVAGTCDPTSGTCSNPNAPDGISCTGSNRCNRTYSCNAGACTGSNPNVCAPPDQCNTAGTCDPTTGQCSPGPSIPGCVATTDHWVSISGRPTPREGAVASAVPTPNVLVLFGGENAGGSLGDTWTWDRSTGLWSVSYANGPGERTAAAAAYDTNRKRLVVFGGILRAASGDSYLADTWEYDPSQRQWATVATPTAPAARAFAAIAFDSVRNKTVLFGGRGPAGAADSGSLWEWDGSQWAQRISTGAPQARATSAMVFDSSRRRLVLFGGETALSPAGGIPFGDTWEMDPQSAIWTNVATAGSPPPRLGHAMYYDSARAKVELFGGTSPAQIAFADTWEYDPATAAWTQRTTTTKPPARAGHTFVFDGATGRGVLAAGVAYSQAGIHSPEFDDIWEYDGAAISWTQRGADVAPALSRPGMVYDTARQTLVLRGDEARPSMWELSAGRWSAKPMLAGLNLDYGLAFSSDTTTLAPSGAQHNELASASLVYDPARARTMLFAGWDPPLYAVDPGRPPEVWEWDGLRWQQRQCTGAPLGLHSAGIAFDAKRERVVIAGGQTTSSARGAPPFFQTWEMDPATCTWTLRNPSIQPPARLLPMMAWDSTRNVVLMFGGGSALADTWEWDGAAGTWSQRTRTSGPPGRARGGLAYDSGRARFVLFGGIGASASTISPDGAALNDLWEYDASAGTWSSVNTAIAPSPRSDVSFAYDPNRAAVALFGGMGQQNSRHGFYQVPQSDLWEWNGMRWAQRTLGSNPVARSGASVGWFPTPRTGMMFGGVRGDGERAFLNDTWLWRSGEWARVSDVGADTVPTRPIRDYGVTKWLPPARAGHAFAVEVLTGGDEIYGVLFGGEGDTGLLDDTWLWDRDQFLWEPLPSAITPPARTGHSLAAIPDRGVLLFGGTGVTGELLGDTYLSIGSGWMPELFGPPPRTSHAMATDLLRGKIVLFGGRGANGALQDTWEWDTQGASGWTQRSAATSPPARFGHSMFYDPNRATIVMVGGAGDDSTSDYGDAWEWNGQAGTWSKLFVTVDLSPRAGALAFFDENRGNPVLFGGLGYRVNGTVATSYGDTWALVRANELPRNGLACTQNNGCGSGFCVDGYCCNTACTDQCTACDVPVVLGTCTPVTGAPHGPRVACPGSPACSTCNGSDTKACHQLAAGTVCTAAACSAGVATTAGACNGSGACLPGSATSCAPYGCAPGVCYTTCGPNAPCPSGDFCNQTSPSNPVCSAYSRFASVTYSPVPTIVNNVVTVTATMSSADAPIFRPIYVTPDNHNLTATCQAAKSPSGWVGTCVFTPTMVGTYTFVLHVASAGSPNLPYDDDQTQLSITVTP